MEKEFAFTFGIPYTEKLSHTFSKKLKSFNKK